MKLLIAAIGLLFIFEGLLPFLAPRIWRRMMQQMFMQSDTALHIFGLVSMLIGLVILYWVF
jgi:uncharacterized protein YjeT (DUF2065 family)